MRTDFAQGQRPTADEALACFVALEMERRAYSDHTRRAYRIAIQAYLDVVSPTASTPADHLNLASVERFARHLERRETRATTRHIKLAAVKAFIAYLEAQEALTTSFSQDIVVPTVERTPPRGARPEDIVAIVRLAERVPRDAALIAFILHTGIRLSELIALTLDDLALPSGERHVATRSAGRSRRGGALGGGLARAACSPVSPDMSRAALLARLRVGARQSGSREMLLDATTAERLAAYLAVRPNTDHRQVFVTKGGAPLTFAAASSLVRKYARAAGMPGVSARSLRAACITKELQSGWSVAEVQAQVGHKGISTTRRYASDSPFAATIPRSVSPLSTARSDARQAAGLPDTRRGGVLVVSGDGATRMALRCALQEAGHAVYEAPDTATAVDMLRLARIPLVVVISLVGAHSTESKSLDLILAGDATLTTHSSIVACPEAGRLPASLANLLASRSVVIADSSLDLDALLTLVERSLATLSGKAGECACASERIPGRERSTA